MGHTYFQDKFLVEIPGFIQCYTTEEGAEELENIAKDGLTMHSCVDIRETMRRLLSWHDNFPVDIIWCAFLEPHDPTRPPRRKFKKATPSKQQVNDVVTKLRILLFDNGSSANNIIYTNESMQNIQDASCVIYNLNEVEKALRVFLVEIEELLTKETVVIKGFFNKRETGNIFIGHRYNPISQKLKFDFVKNKLQHNKHIMCIFFIDNIIRFKFNNDCMLQYSLYRNNEIIKDMRLETHKWLPDYDKTKNIINIFIYWRNNETSINNFTQYQMKMNGLFLHLFSIKSEIKAKHVKQQNLQTIYRANKQVLKTVRNSCFHA